MHYHRGLLLLRKETRIVHRPCISFGWKLLSLVIYLLKAALYVYINSIMYLKLTVAQIIRNFSFVLRHPKVHYYIHKSTLLVSTYPEPNECRPRPLTFSIIDQSFRQSADYFVRVLTTRLTEMVIFH